MEEGSFKGLRRGAWTPEEDNLLKECIDNYGEGKWHLIPLRTGLNRCRKSCRLRWLNYLKPGINRGKFSLDEVDLLLRLHKLLGNRWSLIAGRLPGRTANDVKNYWNTNLGKKQETCCKIKRKNKEITCSTSTPAAKKLNVISLPPQSFSNNNDVLGVGLSEVSTRDGSITCNKDDGKCVFVNNLMDGESMCWERVLEKCQEVDAAGPKATTVEEAENFSMNSMSLTFDVDRLWSLFNKDSEELDEFITQ